MLCSLGNSDQARLLTRRHMEKYMFLVQTLKDTVTEGKPGLLCFSKEKEEFMGIIRVPFLSLGFHLHAVFSNEQAVLLLPL